MEETIKACLSEASSLHLAIGIDPGVTLVSWLGVHKHRDLICLGQTVERTTQFTQGSSGRGDRLVNSLSLCKRYPWFLASVQITDLLTSRNPCPGMVWKIPLPAVHLWSFPYTGLEAIHSSLDIRTSLYRGHNELDRSERWKTQ